MPKTIAILNVLGYSSSQRILYAPTRRRFDDLGLGGLFTRSRRPGVGVSHWQGLCLFRGSLANLPRIAPRRIQRPLFQPPHSQPLPRTTGARPYGLRSKLSDIGRKRLPTDFFTASQCDISRRENNRYAARKPTSAIPRSTATFFSGSRPPIIRSSGLK